jgi:hypothetical protein
MATILYINPHPHEGDDYAVIGFHAKDPLKTGFKTQKAAEDWAKSNYPGCAIHLQRVEKTKNGVAPHWRKAD